MEPDIAKMLRSTAQNISELFNMMATRVEALEKENAELRKLIQSKDE